MPRLEIMSPCEIETKHKASLRHKVNIENPSTSQEDFNDTLLALGVLSLDLGEVTLTGFLESIETSQSFLKLALAR